MNISSLARLTLIFYSLLILTFVLPFLTRPVVDIIADMCNNGSNFGPYMIVEVACLLIVLVSIIWCVFKIKSSASYNESHSDKIYINESAILSFTGILLVAFGFGNILEIELDAMRQKAGVFYDGYGYHLIPDSVRILIGFFFIFPFYKVKQTIKSLRYFGHSK